ncbi:MAG: methionyl-tRNA formyltransferase [Bdellovibrionales bacterium]
MNKSLKIIYMGTPDFSVPALRTLIDSLHDVVAVYTQPPRPKGRGHKVQKSPVHALADIHNIPVYTPASFKKDMDAVEMFRSHDADLAVVAAYGLILPQVILDAPKYGCLNIHASILPRWRGAAPIQYAIWKGDTESGITIMQMEAGLDTGPMISKQTCEITQETTASSLHDRLSDMGGAMLLPLLEELSNGQALVSTPQDDALSNYASMLKKEDGLIDWNNTAEEICRQVRALNPWPGTYCTHNDQLSIKIKAVRVADQISDTPAGTVLDKQGHIVCGHGSVLQITHIQPPNKAAMDFASALNGGYIKVGDVLS